MKKDAIVKILIDNMFKFANIDMSFDKLIESGVSKTNMMWMDNYTMSEEQHRLWKDHSIKLIKKYFRYPYKQARTEFEWFDLLYGLKVTKDIKDINETKSLDFDDLA